MSKDRFTASSYHKMSAAQKRDSSLSVREQAMVCQSCETHVMPADMPAHMQQRCPGPREPGPGHKWVPWRDALGLVPERTLKRWVQKGRVRIKGGRGDQLYLYRDLIRGLQNRPRGSRR